MQRASFYRANGTVPVGFDCCWGNRLADQPTIHRLLRGAGYRTAFMGKAHMANHPEELTDRDARREPDELLGALRGCLARRAAGETTAELFGDQACQQAYLRHQTGADEAAEISWTNIDDINRRSGGAVDFFHEPERMAEAGRAFVGRAVDAGVPIVGLALAGKGPSVARGGFKVVNIQFDPKPADTPPGWHRTETVDFLVVVAGKVVLSLDKGQTTCAKGDVIVQRNSNHGWQNPFDEPCICVGMLHALK